MNKVKTFKDLIIWQKGIELVKIIYEITSSLPKDEKYGIINQMQRASVSVPVNIAEGWARKHTKEFVNFLNIANGSLAELETLINIILELNYLTKNRCQRIIEMTIELQKMINCSIKTLRLRF